MEDLRPGTFYITPQGGRIVFPDLPFNHERHSAALLRIRRTKPVSVCPSLICEPQSTHFTTQAVVHDVELSDLVRRLMAPDPAMRIGLDRALKHKYFDGLRGVTVHQF